jgi:hypothetical protein
MFIFLIRQRMMKHNSKKSTTKTKREQGSNIYKTSKKMKIYRDVLKMEKVASESNNDKYFGKKN